MDSFSGVICALWTPLDERAELDFDALRFNLEWVLGCGARGIMALGSTADFLHLTLDQRKQVLAVIARAAGDRTIIANISEVRLPAVIELGRHAKANGAHAIALLPPWFYPMREADLVEFFVRAGEQAALPLALYNFPEMTGKKLSLAFVRAVAARVPVVAFKQSGGDFAYHEPVARLARELGFTLFTGADTRLAEALGLGASGTVSGLANAVADQLVEWYDLSLKGTPSEGIAELMTALDEKMARIPFTLNIRAAMEARGLKTGALKYPLSVETEQLYRGLVEEVRELFAAASLESAR